MPNQRIKVAIFLAAKGGGSQKVAMSVARGLHERGFEVVIGMPSAEGPYLSLLPEAVRVKPFGTRHPIKVIRAMAAFLKRERPDVILSNQQHINTAALVAKPLSGQKCKVIIVQHNDLTSLMEHTKHRVLTSLPVFIRWLWPKADAVVTVSNDLRKSVESMARFRPSQTHVIYNPVVSEGDLDKASEDPRHPWLTDKELPVILGVGNFNAQKNFKDLVIAFAELRRSKAAKLIILGDGDERPKVQQQVVDLGLSEDVDLPGFASNPFAYMARADVFVLPSIFEGFGNVIIEAMAGGAPVVANDCPSGPGEILGYGKYGQLVPTGDTSAMANAIGATLEEPPDRELIKARAMEFTDQRSYDGYAALIRSLFQPAR